MLRMVFVVAHVMHTIRCVQPGPCDGDLHRPSPPPPGTLPTQLDESFYLLPVLRKTFSREVTPLQFRPPTVSVFPFAGRKSCKISRPSTDLPPVYSKSTCNSYLVLNHDPYRTPTTVVEVRCACRHCSAAGNKASLNDCKPIYNYRRMWRRKCNRKTKSYVDVQVLEPLVVGCTCVKGNIDEPEQPRPHAHS